MDGHIQRETTHKRKPMIHEKQIIAGRVPSKSNSYKVITLHGHGSLAKQKVLKDYESSFFMQCQLRDANITDMFKISLDVFYDSLRPDLDNCTKVILDCLQQCKAIKNDRQCVELHARKLIDKTNPRIEFIIETIEL